MLRKTWVRANFESLGKDGKFEAHQKGRIYATHLESGFV
jgi:hypothetical protein